MFFASLHLHCVCTIACFPCWSLLRSNVCAADGLSLGLQRREGRCRSALLTIGLGLFPELFLAHLFSQILLVVRSALSFCA